MSEQVMPPLAEYDVACHNEGCENATITIRVWATADDPHVVCGGLVADVGTCAQPITDIIAAATPTPPSLGRGTP